jgi:nicotinate dehydrogenase subunit A
MNRSLALKVDGKNHTVTVDPQTPLLYVLRDDLGSHNPRFGCGLSQCGACTVHVDGVAIRSCVTPVEKVEGHAVTTLAGLGTPEHPHPLQTAWIAEQAMQCGYCMNGWIMTAAALLEKTKHPSDEQISAALEGLVCRCGAHAAIVRAVKRAAEAMA